MFERAGPGHPDAGALEKALTILNPPTPVVSANIKGQDTIAYVIATGLVPLDVQVVSQTFAGATRNFSAQPNPTLTNLINTGQVDPTAPFSSLTFSSPANYGGN